MTEPRNKVVQVRRFGDPDGLLCAYGYTAGVQAQRRLAMRSSAASASVAKAWVSGADQSQKRMASLAPAGGRPRRLNSDPNATFPSLWSSSVRPTSDQTFAQTFALIFSELRLLRNC